MAVFFGDQQLLLPICFFEFTRPFSNENLHFIRILFQLLLQQFSFADIIGAKIAAQSGESLNVILVSVKKVSALIAEIAEASLAKPKESPKSLRPLPR